MPREAPHPVTLVPDVEENVDFISKEAVESIQDLWPRNQECARSSFAVPEKDDLVLAVSHAWVYSAHPDPDGLKRPTLDDMLAQALAVHKPSKKTLMFVDFLSVSQPPSRPEDRDRTPEQEISFAKALRAFPQIYLQADAVLHVDVEPRQIEGELSFYSASLAALEGATLMQWGDSVHVSKVPKDSDTSVQAFDVIDSVGGVRVRTIEEYEQARKQLLERVAGRHAAGGGWLGTWCSADTRCGCLQGAEVRMRWCPFGAYSSLMPGQKGWVYLERFASMVKGAMVPEERIETVAFASSAEAKAEILDGARRLREAAALGRDKLSEALSYFVDRLEEKHFTAASLDKAKNVGGIGGVARDALQAKQWRDQDVVGQLMRELVNDLARNWEEEHGRQLQRQLIMAVNRGDLKAAAQLIEGGADLNLADGQGATCMHQAAKGRNLDMVKLLVDSNGDLTAQDVQGNTPSHMVALFADQLTIDLFEALAPTAEILTLTNNAGVSPFDRFDVWSSTAVGNKPFEVADRLVKRLSAKMPELLEPRRAAFERKTLSGAVHIVESQVEVHVGARTIPVPVFHASGSNNDEKIVVWVGMAAHQPRQIQEEALKSIVGMVCSRVNAKVYFITEDIYCEGDLENGMLPLQKYVQGIRDVVKALPLTGKYVFVDNSIGLGVPVLWENQARLQHGIVLNPVGWFSEEFVTSAGYKGMMGKVSQHTGFFKQKKIEKCLDSVGSFVFTRTETDIALVKDCYRDALLCASPLFFKANGGLHMVLDGMPRMYSELPNLHSTVPLDLVCGAYSPALLVQDTVARIRDRAPGAQVKYIANSKQWWELEGRDQLIDVAMLLVAALQKTS